MITLRTAQIDDLALLEYWDQQEHVLAADPEKENWEYELGRSPSWRQLLIAEYRKRPIGCIQIIDPAKEETHYWGNIGMNRRAIDIWIGEKSFLNQGHGTEMMKQAIARCFANEAVEDILIDPLATNTDAIRFYERLGFHFVERRRFGEDDCKVYVLKRSDYLSEDDK